jgi:dephospho-CoA kinase
VRAAALTALAPEGAVVVQVIPLLVETGQQGNFDQVVVVDVDPEVQLSRIVRRDGLNEAEAQARLRAQASRGARLAAAHVVLRNNGTRDDLAAAVDRLWAEWESVGP